MVVQDAAQPAQQLNQNLGPAQSAPAGTAAMTVNTRELKNLESEKRKAQQQLEMKKQRREIEDIKREIDDEDALSSRQNVQTRYTPQSITQIPGTRYAPPTQPTTTAQATAAPIRIGRREHKVDVYWNLGLMQTQKPSDAQIREAYMRCTMQHHPDRVSHKTAKERDHSANRMREIGQAKAILIDDPGRKRAYDDETVIHEHEFVAWKQRRDRASRVGGSTGFAVTRRYVP